MARRSAFQAAFSLLLRRRGEALKGLQRALRAEGCRIDRKTLALWADGTLRPAQRSSFKALACLERRWGLPAGYFRSLLPPSGRAVRGAAAALFSPAERRRLAWHLPEDFEDRPSTEQAEIAAWVRRVMVSGATGYRRYHVAKLRHPFALHFPDLGARRPRPGSLLAPAQLQSELAELIAFKTSVLAPRGYSRRTAWASATARQKIEHFGLLFGALAASADGPVAGLAIDREELALALLTFPGVWDAYLDWRFRRRGFFTSWEDDMLKVAASLTHPTTGWFPQRPDLADRLSPIPPFVDETDIAVATADWRAHCADAHAFVRSRAKEVRRLARVHNDPFEPILPVLEAERPVAEYRRIAEEIQRRRPQAAAYPKAAAESARAYLMIRLGLHLGFRQRNLRELLVAPPGRPHTSEPELARRRRGELRWSLRRRTWEVFAPAAAFKNSGSRFFSGGPFQLELPDLAGFYAELEAYLAVHRPILLGPARDPGVLFVKTATASTRDAAYDGASFYEAWRTIIRRYGVYNPWTGRGAIRGLLPHGPQSVRDVLATHVLKHTGSYEQASYAIQDTPETLYQHYGRFLPQQKAAVAARVLNRAWDDAGP